MALEVNEAVGRVGGEAVEGWTGASGQCLVVMHKGGYLEPAAMEYGGH